MSLFSRDFMPKEDLKPSQWVVDVCALADASGRFLQEAGGTITTVVAVACVSTIVGVCVFLVRDLPPWAQLLLGVSGAGGVTYDPKKGSVTQQFQKPVENAIATPSTTINEAPAASNSHLIEQDDDDEWVTPQEVIRR
jgi:hypothetical protein